MFKNFRPSRRRMLHIFILLLLLFDAVAYSGSNNSIRLNLQHSVFDEFNRHHPRQLKDESHKVVIIDIDEKSLELIGQWHWPRNVMADLTDSLSKKGAKVIAFDGVFAEEDRTSPHVLYKDFSPEQIADLPDTLKNGEALLNYDQLFAESMRDSKVFVTAFTYGRPDRDRNQPLDKKRVLARSDVKQVFLENATPFEAAATNLPVYAKAAAGNGSFMARPDKDGVLRRVGLLFTNNKTIYPSLSLEILRVAELGRKGTVRLAEAPEENLRLIDTNYRIAIGDRIIPVESDGLLNAYYRYFCNGDDVAQNPELCPAADYIPAYKFLLPGYDDEARKAVEGKIVLIGASAEGLKDLRSTALQPFRPGVEVHANIIEQVLGSQYLLRPSITVGAEASYIIVAGLFFILLAPFFGVFVSVALCFMIIALAIFGAYYAYVQYGLLMDPVYPSLSVLGIFIVSTILSYARAEARRKEIRDAFGMYVASDVMHDLERDPEKLKLGGESRELSVMFTDIRNFTGISEGLAPEALIQLMNDFLTQMTDIVMSLEGTVDKYIGDAMMCFWNAPREVEDHERKACRAALKMSDALAPINEALRKKAKEEGKEPVLLQAGIGVNAGLCAVGNMGSRQRFAYSALGDAVNIASRLEGQSKLYGINIIIGQSIYEKVTDFAVIELDKVRVIGKGEPIVIYGLLGDEELVGKEYFQNWIKVHKKMLELYRERKFKEALEKVETCVAMAGSDYHRLYALYEERLTALLKSKKALPKDWDGTIDAQMK